MIRLEMTGQSVLPADAPGGLPPLVTTPSRINAAGHAMLPDTPQSADASPARDPQPHLAMAEREIGH